MNEYKGFSKYYDLLNEGRFDYSGEASAVSEFFKKYNVKEVMDITCGTGNHIIHLAEMGYSCSANDLSQEMVDIAKNKANEKKLNIEFFTSDVCAVNGNSPKDGVYSLHALSLLKDKESVKKAVQSAYNCLKEGGVFVCDIMDKTNQAPGFNQGVMIDSTQNETCKIVQMHKTMFDGNDQHWETSYIIEENGNTRIEIFKRKCLMFTKEELESMFTDVGFKIESISKSLLNYDVPEESFTPDWIVFATK
jgi:2-polyprenyl-3-methyl-5-hydroxy-6-metoxy-1,4-benzoquinol methylase